ncbi:helix-turn-helix domain-containing protein [Bordetella hinzii]|uniref:helix-turn-helix domain-containing protein n=1 Tax=Bordetella hinzii TaxID=103855 RepID=UPI00049612BE|nr:helix-turn-helix transcriptional regulator [Bordetella hinzii]QDJ43823.1 transcriptional regulator [Bordetella hinzii]
MPDVKEILAQSVARLLETRPDISRLNLSKLMGVADGTLGRIKYGTGNPNVETVEQIARYFKFEAWQLLVAGFDPASPPRLAEAPSSASADGEPPLQLSREDQELLALFQALKEPERTYLLLNARGYAAANPHAEQRKLIKSTGSKVA